jgi:hypothetical protein
MGMTRQQARRPAAFLSMALAATFVAAMVRPVSAELSQYLYHSNVIVTGYDMRQRPWGFAQALREVIVKLTGEPRLRDDPRVLALANHPDGYVTFFSYIDLMAYRHVHDDQGTYDRPYDLTVHFDPAKIDKFVADIGERPWSGERPVIVPVIAMRGFTGTTVLDADDPNDATQLESMRSVARDFAISARFPTKTELRAWGVSINHVAVAHPEPSPHEALVTGTLVFDESIPGWVGSWRMRWKGTDYAWGIRGVNYDEAFRDIVRGVVRVASGHGKPD